MINKVTIRIGSFVFAILSFTLAASPARANHCLEETKQKVQILCDAVYGKCTRQKLVDVQMSAEEFAYSHYTFRFRSAKAPRNDLLFKTLFISDKDGKCSGHGYEKQLKVSNVPRQLAVDCNKLAAVVAQLELKTAAPITACPEPIKDFAQSLKVPQKDLLYCVGDFDDDEDGVLIWLRPVGRGKCVFEGLNHPSWN